MHIPAFVVTRGCLGSRGIISVGDKRTSVSLEEHIDAMRVARDVN